MTLPTKKSPSPASSGPPVAQAAASARSRWRTERPFVRAMKTSPPNQVPNCANVASAVVSAPVWPAVSPEIAKPTPSAHDRRDDPGEVDPDEVAETPPTTIPPSAGTRSGVAAEDPGSTGVRLPSRSRGPIDRRCGRARPGCGTGTPVVRHTMGPFDCRGEIIHEPRPRRSVATAGTSAGPFTAARGVRRPDEGRQPPEVDAVGDHRVWSSRSSSCGGPHRLRAPRRRSSTTAPS